MNRPVETPAPAVVFPSAACVGSTGEPDLVEGDLLLVGVAWYRLGPDLEVDVGDPVNRRPEGGLW